MCHVTVVLLCYVIQEQLKRVIRMNKVNPKSFAEGEFVDEDALAMQKMANAALSLFPKGPEPVKRTSRLLGPKPVEE